MGLWRNFPRIVDNQFQEAPGIQDCRMHRATRRTYLCSPVPSSARSSCSSLLPLRTLHPLLPAAITRYDAFRAAASPAFQFG